MSDGARMNVLLLPVMQLFKPWCDDIVTAVGTHHDLSIYDADRSIAAQFRDVDVVIDHGGHVGTREMMDAAVGARLWQIMSIGYEHVDVAYLTSRGLKVANSPGTTSAASLAQTALMMILMLAHRARECERNFREGLWLEPSGIELEGKTMGIVGLGHSGRRLAALTAALRMRVIGVNRTPIDPTESDASSLAEVRRLDQLDSLLKESDVVSLHLAVTDQTRGILDRRRIELMKPTAWLINVARGALLDEPALYEMILAGRIGGAGLDVFDPEPPDVAHPVFALPNVVVTPHIAAYTDGSSRKRAACIAENIDRVAAGLEPLYRVD